MRYPEPQKMLTLIAFCLPALTFANSDYYNQRTLDGIHLAYNMQFDKATEIFAEIIELDPENPHGYLLQCVNYYYRFQLEENHLEFEKKFLDYSAIALKKSMQQLSDPNRQLDALFYLGTVHMYLAAYHGWESNWLKAYWYGKKGISYLEKVVARDPSYYDAYLGLGLYHYYSDVIPKFAKAISFLLGIKSDRQKGLQELEIAAEKGIYSKAEAMLFLGSIHLYIEKNYQQSLNYFKKLVHFYPDNLSYLMLLGENYQKVRQYDLAVTTLNKVIRDDSHLQNTVLKISTHFRLGNLYFSLNDFEQAIEHYTKSLDLAHASTGNVKWVLALANLNLGKCYDMLDDRQKAVEYYQQVKKSDHKNAYNLAQNLIKQSMKKPDRVAAVNHTQPERGADDIANGIYESAISPTPTRRASRLTKPEVKYQIGKIYMKQKAYVNAIDEFKKILAMQNVEKNWIKPWCHYYLGVAYKALGSIEKALSHFASAYEFNEPRLREQIDKAREKLE
ncbi:MAG: tetratricopeptide repeat protein [bacterium]